MTGRFVRCVLAVIVAAALPSVAHAHLSINKLWVDFVQGHDERSDIVIRNDGKDRYYVTVTVSEIVDPGTPNERRVQQVDPEKSGLLVTPNRLVLDPGALRSIRLVSLNQNLTKDRIYRVLISPQVGAIKTAADQKDDKALAIKMLAAYDVLVVVRPSDASADLQAVRTPGEVTITNSGNTNILLANGLVCPLSVGSDMTDKTCRTIDADRLYAGNSLSIPLSAPTDRVIVKTRESAVGAFKTRQF